MAKHKKPILPRRERRAEYSLLQKYDLTYVDYIAMVQDQDSLCGICGRPLVVFGEPAERPNVDHCHTTGKVRGILCYTCNMGLGYFKDNKRVLEAAILYIDKSQE